MFKVGAEMDEVWLSITEVAKFWEQPRISIVRKIANSEVKYRRSPSGLRKKYQIPLSELPKEAQERYFQSLNMLAHPVVIAPPKLLSEEDMEAYLRAPDWQKQFINRWNWILAQTANMKKKEIMYWIAQTGEKVSYRSILRMRQRVQDDGIKGLFSAYGKKKNRSIVPQQLFEVFKNAYLQPNAPTLNSAYQAVLDYTKENSPELLNKKFPSKPTFLYRLNREFSYSAIYLARYGEKAWKRKFAYDMNQNSDKLDSGSVAICDYSQLDFIVRFPDGSSSRPWITAWIDSKSGKFLSWYLHKDPPNLESVFQAFHTMALNYGIPQYLYVNNQKYCKAKKDNSTNYIKISLDEKYAATLWANIGVEVHFQLPYTSNRSIKQYFKKFHSYCYAAMRPAADEEELKVRHHEIFDLAKVERLLDSFIEQNINESKNELSHSPNEIWGTAAPVMRKLSSKFLSLFCPRTKGLLRVGIGGIKDLELGIIYWSEELEKLLNSYVYLRRDIKVPETAWVFNEKNELICEVKLVGKISLGKSV